MSTILLLSLLILVHELGHYLAARRYGVKVEEFGIGIPPKILTLFRWRGTEFSLNWLPLGGFVRLYGEDSDPKWWEQLNPWQRKQALGGKPAWQRVIIMAAGVLMNLIAGVALFTAIYTHTGVPVEKDTRVVVARVIEGSPAELAGIKEGDIMVRVGAQEIVTSDQFIELLRNSGGKAVEIYLGNLKSDGQESTSYRQLMVVPRENPPEGEGALGVGVVELPTIVYEKKQWYVAPFYGLSEGVKEAYGWTRIMLKFLLNPVQLWQGLSGPFEVVKIGQEQAAEGWISFLRFGGIISFNLAVFNLLPIPALDGGRIVMVMLEKVVGRKRIAGVEKYVNATGMIALLLLMIVVTVRDLLK